MASVVSEFLNTAKDTVGSALGSAGEFLVDRALDQFRNELQALPPEQRFNALKEKVSSFPLDDTAQGKIDGLMEHLEKAPPQAQEALTHAIANNEHFLGYLLDNTGAEGGLTTAAMDSLFIAKTDDKGNPIKDENGDPEYVSGPDGKYVLHPQNSGPILDILNTIGNTPDEDFSGKLDKIGTAYKDYQNAKGGDPDVERAALYSMYDAVREAGGNVPAFAKMNEDVALAFLNDFFTQGSDRALSNMIDSLNMSPEQAAALQRQMGPILDIMGPMLQPYAELWQKHGDTFIAGFNSMRSDGATLGGIRVEAKDYSFEKTVPDGEITTDISRDQFIEKFKAAMEDKPLTEENIREAVNQIDSRFTDETVLILTDTKLSAMFKNAVDVTNVDSVANSLANVRDELEATASDAAMPVARRVESALTP